MRAAAIAVALMALAPAVVRADGATMPPRAGTGEKPPPVSDIDRPPTSRPASRPAGVAQSPVYRPPRRGSPREKVGSGGLRGAPALPRPLALAPPHLAHTVRASPDLFWHLDVEAPAGSHLLFTLLEDMSPDPVAEIELAPGARPGIQRISLKAHGIELAVGVEYEWSVVVVADDRHGLATPVDRAYVKRIARPPTLVEEASVHAYAEAGLWYDALAAISDAIAGSPDQHDLRAQRDALLIQAGLDTATEGAQTATR